MPPQLHRVIRLDSVPLKQTYFTEEGYLVDRPIVTSTGIFEYRNPDGSMRRELRLPEEVFDPASLESYRGKPVVLTHDAGLVTKDNVRDYQVGTIMSDGYRSGSDVRAEIIVHDTDAMKRSHLRELSLGYNLDLDETPGEWKGMHYDAIQRNIRINHLALVRDARAGDQARLNIDSRDGTTLIGGKAIMRKTIKKTRRNDSVLSPEELSKAIEEYKARRSEESAPAKPAPAKAAPKPAPKAPPFQKKAPAAPAPAPMEEDEDDTDIYEDEDETEFQESEDTELYGDADDTEAEGEEDDYGDDLATDEEDQVSEIRARNSDADEDMRLLFDIIDTLLADRAFDSAMEEQAAAEAANTDCGPRRDADDEEAFTEDEDDEEAEGSEEPVIDDDDEEPEESAMDEAEAIVYDNGKPIPVSGRQPAIINTDSIDAIVRQRVCLSRMADKLNLDGLDSMKLMDAKKAVISVVTPSLRLDGKSNTYVNALYDRAVAEVDARTRKDTSYQVRQMFNRDSGSSISSSMADTDSAEARRKAMIARRQKKEEK